jgi:hypothetical protein
MTQNYKTIVKEIVFPYEIRFRGVPPLLNSPRRNDLLRYFSNSNRSSNGIT